MNSIEIGKVIEITNSDIIVEVFQKYESSHLVVNSEPVRLTGVGSFLRINELIYQIDLEKITDTNLQKNNNKIAINRVLRCSLIGYFENERFLEGTNGNTPDLFQTVYKTTPIEEHTIYSNTTEKNSLKLGHYVLNKDISFIFDVNKFIASHILIVGNTGSGKSNTLASLYEKLFDKFGDSIVNSNSKFLIIDSNGEYGESFTKIATLVNRKQLNVRGKTNSLKIPIKSLNEDDWKILLEATEKTQFPIIKKVITTVKEYIFDSEKNTSKITDLINWKTSSSIRSVLESNETPNNKIAGLSRINEMLTDYVKYSKEDGLSVPLTDICDKIEVNNNRIKWRSSIAFADDLQEIIAEFGSSELIKGDILSYGVNEFELLLSLENIFRINKYNINESNTSPMLSRFVSNKSSYIKLFEPFNITRSYSYEDLEYLIFNKKAIAICDFSKAGKNIAKSIVSLLASKFFENAVEKRSDKSDFSYHIIIDEAHNYLSRNSNNGDSISESCIEAFEKIIKEGRKFNTFVTMATQRPSEITPTLLSQAHNYVIHKLVNPNDISIIKNTVPFLDEMSSRMISILSPGQAIFSGTAFSKPSIVKVDMPLNKVKSDTVNLLSIWRK